MKVGISEWHALGSGCTNLAKGRIVSLPMPNNGSVKIHSTGHVLSDDLLLAAELNAHRMIAIRGAGMGNTRL